jgi:hypothetical protein
VSGERVSHYRELFGQHHNRQKIVPHRKASEREGEQAEKKNVAWRRDGGVVSEIRWVFLELWVLL